MADDLEVDYEDYEPENPSTGAPSTADPPEEAPSADAPTPRDRDSDRSSRDAIDEAELEKRRKRAAKFGTSVEEISTRKPRGLDDALLNRGSSRGKGRGGFKGGGRGLGSGSGGRGDTQVGPIGKECYNAPEPAAPTAPPPGHPPPTQACTLQSTH